MLFLHKSYTSLPLLLRSQIISSSFSCGCRRMLLGASTEEMEAGEEVRNGTSLAGKDWKCTVLPNLDSPALGQFPASPHGICTAHLAMFPASRSALAIYKFYSLVLFVAKACSQDV